MREVLRDGVAYVVLANGVEVRKATEEELRAEGPLDHALAMIRRTEDRDDPLGMRYATDENFRRHIDARIVELFLTTNLPSMVFME